jgi:SAM-dependent methyltransferase
MDLQVSFRRGYEPVTRLRFLSGLAWSSPDALYRRAGLASGMRCLDVRCGTGQATLPMARIAGPDGQVLGIDPEVRLLEQARHEAARQGLSMEFRVGDLADLSDNGSFDFVYTRYLLSRSSRDEAERALKQMMAMVQPGGTIVVEDLDCSPEADGRVFDNPAYTRFLELFNALIRGGEPSSPRRQQLPQLLEHAGVAGVQCTEAPSPVVTDSHMTNPASLMLASIRNAIVAAQLATRTEVDRLTAELDRFRVEPHRMFGLPKIIQVWGRVPTLVRAL